MLVKGIFTSISGSIGGMTGSHNKGGQYLRGRTTPVNPNTTAQQTARTRFTASVDQWAGFTEAQRTAWNDFAAIQAWTNRQGDAIQLSGQQAFVGSASAMRSAGLTPVTAPPTPNTRPPVQPFGTIFLTADPAFDVTPVGGLLAGDRVVYSLGRRIGPGQKFYNGPFRIVASVAGNSVALIDFLTFLSPPNVVAEGDKIPMRIRTVLATGQYSPFGDAVQIAGPAL